ncbi:hypothetical protein SASPL_126330 [Salvia splendens]|uniref:C3H1-type domain-containing protein n=1 Tax=Salvia splendens TaxID=180675 RepID=A0A8X8XGT3_SALSN|nr:hypothetical protein SASPL_126330 [Salvia splendens]
MDSRKRGRPESSYGGASKKSKTARVFCHEQKFHNQFASLILADSVSLFLPTTPHYTSRISAFSRISQFIFFVIGYKAVPGAIKTKMCIKFKTEGGCMFGDKCSFAHGERELIAPSDRGGVDLCLAETTRGILISNTSSLKVHSTESRKPARGKIDSNSKKKLCKNFTRGSCMFGERCHFAHVAD